MPENLATCTKCGTMVPTSDVAAERQPCPKCGSLGRRDNADLKDSASASVHDQYRMRRKDDSRRSKDKLRLEILGGYDLHRDTGKWNLKDRVIDKDNDHYFEHVVDPVTGETVHKCEEPLSDHFDHGSAKKPDDDT